MSALETADFRLPRSVRPHRYDLHLIPDLDAATFTGTEEVVLEVTETTDRIVMNAAELTVSAASIISEAGGDGTACGIELDETNERVSFVPPAPLAPGRYVLQASFEGELNDKLRGFYRSRFRDDDGNEHIIATTQFESTDARRAFPCFDEPDRKAVFGVTLDIPAGMLGISNGPEIGRIDLGEGRSRIRFGDTIPMSTYLVAFVVGPLEATEPIDVNGVALRVVHAPGKAHLTAPAIEVAAHALGYFADYFGLAYPGEKLDLVAVPDFAAGAMENLGCVTFRDAILLADPNATAQSEMERLAEVVEHELAHMWFGDLVTMGWWNGLWLNEAFATFMSLRCQDDFRPEWKCFVSFARGKSATLAVDGLHSTRPIEFEVHAPEEAQAMFDVLTYEKGAGVLWMIEQYLGEDLFRDGVRRYLAAHSYGNTETGDLWDAIEVEAGDIPIRALMDSWIFQGGYPLVSVDRTGTGAVRLSQEPFAYLPTPDEGSAIGHDWLVPLLVAPVGATKPAERVLLGKDAEEFEAGAGAVVVNAGGSGFYRLRYDAELRSALVADLGALSALERYNLVADTWASVLALRSDLGDFLAIVEKFGTERDPHVWSIVLGAFGLMDLVAAPTDRPVLASAVRQLLGPVLDQVGLVAGKDEDDQLPLLRSSLYSVLGTIGQDPKILEHARGLFSGDHGGGTSLPADLASAVLGVVAAHATREEFEAILARQRKPESPLDENRHLGALGSIADPAITAEIRELAVTEIRTQNAPFLLGSLLRNRSAGEATWAFIVERFEHLVEIFPESSIHRMLDGISALAGLDDAGEPLLLGEVRNFVETKVTGGRRRLVEQSLERLEVNVRFAKAIKPRLGDLLGDFAPAVEIGVHDGQPRRLDAYDGTVSTDAMPEPVIFVTDAARSFVVEARAGEPTANVLALFIEISGVSGDAFTYDMWFESPSDAGPSDAIHYHDDLTVVVGEQSISRLKGAALDVGETGLVILNPNTPPPPPGSAPPPPVSDLSSPLEQAVLAVLTEEINPQLATHGGRVELVAVTDNIAYLRLSGGCQGCGLAAVTLSQGISVAIREEVPEIVEIVDVTSHAEGTNPYFEAAKK